jgi:gliding motility-associated-like protein
MVNDGQTSGVNTPTLLMTNLDNTYNGLHIRQSFTYYVYGTGYITEYSNDAILSIGEVFFQEETDSMCLGSVYYWRNDTILQAGIYYDSLQTVDGCDSVYKLNLSVINYYKYDTVSICEGDSIFLQNQWQNTEGTYYDTVVYQNSCDTILQTQLYIEYKNKLEYQYICEGDSMFLGGAWQTEPGLYFDSYVSENGCDINLRTRLLFKSSSDTTITKSICEGDSCFFNGEYYSTEGTYYHTLSGINGCDSVITLVLSVIDLPDIKPTATPSEIEDGETSQLYIEDVGNISWYSTDTTMSCTDCNNPIVGPAETTTYYVTVQVGFCEISDSVTVKYIEPEFDVDIPEGFSPNKDGINDAFVIKYLEKFPNNEIRILNRWGHKVFEAKPYVNNWRGTNFFGISIGEDLPEGTYYYILQLHDNKKQVFKGYIYIKR